MTALAEGCFADTNDHGDRLWDCAHSVACDVGTPFYLYDPTPAISQFRRLRQALASWGPGCVAYSLKTNPLIPLLRDLREAGALVEVTSPGEYDIARSAGYRNPHVILNGPLKYNVDGSPFRPPVAITNIDSFDELARYETAGDAGPQSVGVRICPPRRDGPSSRFGLEWETGEAAAAIRFIIDRPWLSLGCIQFHLGTQVAVHDYAANVALAEEIWNHFDLDPEVWLDLGGGFPFRHDRSINAQPFKPFQLFEDMRALWKGNDPPQLLVEPGRWIAAPTLILIARVLAHKPRSSEPTIVVVDGGTNLNVMTAFYEHEWSFSRTFGGPKAHRMCGPLCMEDDVMSGARTGPLPLPGSLVGIRNAGAYSLSLSRSFIQSRAPVVELDPEFNYKVVLQRESLSSSYAIQEGSRQSVR